MLPSSRRLILSLLLVSAVCPYFIDLDGSSIWDANEAFYVETPREMIERADYISPAFNYEPRFNKPILSYWIVVAFYKLFGVSIAAERLPIAIGGVVLIAVAFFLGRAAESTAGFRSGDAALWAAVGLAVAPRLLMFARRILIDIYISMFMGLTLLFFALAERQPTRHRLWLLLMYVAIGFGMLTKGPIAAVLPALTFAIYLAVNRELSRVGWMMIPAGIIIVLAIVVPWYAIVYQRSGWTYIASFFIGENFGRYTEGIGVEQGRGPLFYLPTLLSDSFPWSLLLFPAAALWLRDRRMNHVVQDPAFRIRTLLWIWILVIVAFFSFSAAKQDLYIFPIVPAVAALGGVTITRGLNRSSGSLLGSIALRMTAAVMGAIVAMLGAGLLYLFRATGAVYSLDGILAIGIVAVAGGIFSISLAMRALIAPALMAVVGTLVIVNWLFVVRTLPSFEIYKPATALAEDLRSRAGPDDTIATYELALPSLVFYLHRHIDPFYDRARFVELLTSNGTVYAVLSSENYDAIRDEIPVRTCVITRHRTFDVKLKNMLVRERLPELLLITNRCASS